MTAADAWMLAYRRRHYRPSRWRFWLLVLALQVLSAAMAVWSALAAGCRQWA